METYAYKQTPKMITFKPRPHAFHTYIVFTDAQGVSHAHFTPRYVRQENATNMLQEMVQLKCLTYDEAFRIEDLIHSEDEENLTVAEEIIYQKIK